MTHPQSPPRIVLGVSACLLADGEVLLVERGRPPFAGKLSLPGGRVEFGESLADAIRREVREETGLDVADLGFLRFHEAIDVEAGIHVVIAVFAGHLPAGAQPLAGDDAAAIALHPIAVLDGMQSAGRLTDGLAPIVAEAAARIGDVAEIRGT
ncbi:NUDIX hydrolase [Antarcticirhabdus aurantiaca]|uniref:NUDIX domain-containing protein n=1 Tax=Antarcticirhabdus aurantiaca TaxID=2606717 RepID=A0ACD4NIJ8_9HYPH|nr:NUDIX domain-containing protein [Antarcticirhabdus aurantiaca]WAJ26606.1 NUDIX domain-containing protein [Jeongeuplla avenae]